MTRAAIRNFAMPILQGLVGEAAKAFLNPCTRLTWWRLRQQRRAKVYRPTWFADWRVEVLAGRCHTMKANNNCTVLA